MALISLLHPSRGRCNKAFETHYNWHSKAGTVIEHILSIDSDDKDRDCYSDRYSLIVNQNKSVVEATNRAAEQSNGDILIYLSDDFDCPDNWGQLILKEFEGVTEPMLLKVDDCLQPFNTPILTIPIMNRALYERLGYFWHPDYKSMFVDQHLYEVCKKYGWLKLAPYLKFPHNHHSIGKAQNDETYRRSEANWEQGKALFAKHKAMGFPI